MNAVVTFVLGISGVVGAMAWLKGMLIGDQLTEFTGFAVWLTAIIVTLLIGYLSDGE